MLGERVRASSASSDAQSGSVNAAGGPAAVSVGSVKKPRTPTPPRWRKRLTRLSLLTHLSLSFPTLSFCSLLRNRYSKAITAIVFFSPDFHPPLVFIYIYLGRFLSAFFSRNLFIFRFFEIYVFVIIFLLLSSFLQIFQIIFSKYPSFLSKSSSLQIF